MKRNRLSILFSWILIAILVTSMFNQVLADADIPDNQLYLDEHDDFDDNSYQHDVTSGDMKDNVQDESNMEGQSASETDEKEQRKEEEDLGKDGADVEGDSSQDYEFLENDGEESQKSFGDQEGMYRFTTEIHPSGEDDVISRQDLAQVSIDLMQAQDPAEVFEAVLLRNEDEIKAGFEGQEDIEGDLEIFYPFSLAFSGKYDGPYTVRFSFGLQMEQESADFSSDFGTEFRERFDGAQLYSIEGELKKIDYLLDADLMEFSFEVDSLSSYAFLKCTPENIEGDNNQNEDDNYSSNMTETDAGTSEDIENKNDASEQENGQKDNQNENEAILPNDGTSDKESNSEGKSHDTVSDQEPDTDGDEDTQENKQSNQSDDAEIVAEPHVEMESKSALSAQSLTCGESLTWSFQNGTLTITGRGRMNDYKDDTDIPWKAYKDSIKTVRIGSGVTRIGNSAFYKCVNLTDITIPYSVTEIGSCAFYECKSLERIDLPDRISVIEYRTFYNCTNLKKMGVLTIEGHEHAYGDWLVVNAATCTTAGQEERICSICNEKETRTIQAKGHQWGANYTTDEAASCTNDGKESIHCSVCNAVEPGSERTINKTGHSYGDWSVAKTATCTENGSEKHVCRTCGYEETRETALLGHTFGEWGVTKAPTCTEAGKKERKCTRCGYTETQDIRANGHQWNENYTTDSAANCANDGKESIHCSVCNSKKDGSDRTIPKLGHSFGEWSTTNTATCTEGGILERTCSRCREKETKTIQANGHQWGDHYTTDTTATCTNDGKESIHCSVCNAIQPGSERAIKKTGHNYDDWSVVKTATCTEKGLEKRACRVCRHEETRETALLGHTFGEWSVTKAATCTETGKKERKCTRCGHTEAQDFRANGHQWNGYYSTDRAATCKIEGKESIHCSVCNSKKEDSERTIPKLGHSFGEWSAKNAATCTEGGIVERICSGCGEVETKSIPANGHQWRSNYTTDIAATCSDDGIESIHCALCNSKKENSERIIPKLGHTYGVWVITKQPSCAEPGSKERICFHCYEKETQAIDPIGHHWRDDYITDSSATCTEDGKESIHCYICNSIKEGSERVVPKLGHTFGVWITTKYPTCAEAGSKERICTRCLDKDIQAIGANEHQWYESYVTDRVPTCIEDGAESIHCAVCGSSKEGSERQLPKLGHSFGEWQTTKRATCTEAGTEERVCDRCGENETQDIPSISHNWESAYTVDEEPFDDQPGRMSIHCSECGSIQEDSVREFFNAHLAFESDSLTKTYSTKQTFEYALTEIETDGQISYASSDTKVATVDPSTGMVTIVGAGTATITAISSETESHLVGSASYELIVDKAPNQITASGYTKTSTGKDQSFKIKVKRLGKAKLTFKSNKSGVKVTSSGNVTIKGSFAGNAIISIKAAKTNNYQACTLNIAVTVKPMKTVVSSVKNLSGKKLTVSWKKNDTATGYQVQYALDKGFTKGKTAVTITKKSTTKKTFSGLKNGKTYYVRIRAYKSDGGEKYFSAWSPIKTIKVTK